MSASSSRIDSEALLQEGVSCAIATLYAITGTGLLDALPAAADDRIQHNHGLWLLAMLRDHLERLQESVDGVEAPGIRGRRANA